MDEDNEYTKDNGFLFTSMSVDAILLCPFYLRKLLISETMTQNFYSNKKTNVKQNDRIFKRKIGFD